MVNYKLGKKLPRIDKRTLQFKKYLTELLPTPPSNLALYKNASATWGMMGNDKYGDCTCAAAGHMVQEWTANANPPELTIPDAAILAAYNVVDGGVDQGADMLTVLNYWRNAGIGGHSIDAFVQLANQNHLEVMQAVDLFGAAYIGLELPDYIFVTDPLTTPWDLPPGATSYPPGNPSNGHCVCVVGYDDVNLYVVTWGEIKAMAWGFYDAYMDEAYGVLSSDWIEKSGESPPGFNLSQLNSDLNAIQNETPSPNPPVVVQSWWQRFITWLAGIFGFGKKK
jgi:hypothetical protein